MEFQQDSCRCGVDHVAVWATLHRPSPGHGIRAMPRGNPGWPSSKS